MSVIYKLVHITTGGEYKTPLVASQLFDQAEFQAIDKQGEPPADVEAWVIGSAREYFDNNAKGKIKSLRTRCPHVTIRMINGINRLNNFPLIDLMKWYRKKMDTKIPVVYHCRGESAAQWAIQLRKFFPHDKVVLDVRGFWPAELLYKRGIQDMVEATGADLADYTHALNRLKKSVKEVDAITTVSAALKELLINDTDASTTTSVVPCCVNKITDDSKRDEIRKSWGVNNDEIVIVYSGTTAAYQHLEDLTIPFMKMLSEANHKIRLAFFSSELEKIKKMLGQANLDVSQIILKNFSQEDVAYALTACDAGVLIRKPTLVNKVANPVKIAEYMAAGLPIIIEKGVGGVSEDLFERSLLCGIEIASGENIVTNLKNVIDWIGNSLHYKRSDIRSYVAQVYFWPNAIHVSQKMYKKVLGN